MSTENSQTNNTDKFTLTLADKRNLKDPKRNMTLANLIIHYAWKNVYI